MADTSNKTDSFEEAFQKLSEDVATAVFMEAVLSGKTTSRATKSRSKQAAAPQTEITKDPVEVLKEVLHNCNKRRKMMDTKDETPPSDEELSRMSRFTDKFKLIDYQKFLHFVPRLVNVVTVCAPPTQLAHTMSKRCVPSVRS